MAGMGNVVVNMIVRMLTRKAVGKAMRSAKKSTGTAKGKQGGGDKRRPKKRGARGRVTSGPTSPHPVPRAPKSAGWARSVPASTVA